MMHRSSCQWNWSEYTRFQKNKLEPLNWQQTYLHRKIDSFFINQNSLIGSEMWTKTVRSKLEWKPVWVFWCEESVVPPSSRGRRPLLIFLHLIYLLSLPDCLPVLFFLLLISRQLDGKFSWADEWQCDSGEYSKMIIDHTISRIETNKPAAADTN